MYSRGNQYDGREKRGLRCRICTGCGLCSGVTPAAGGRKPHVLAEDALLGERKPFEEGERRLVTADIGTTTIAMLLYGKDGAVADRYMCLNPQAMYGADVISRIRASENPEAAEEMRRQVLEVLEQGLRRFQQKISEGERLQMVLASNTTMTYLLMGWNTGELGCAPFSAAHLAAVETKIREVPCFVFPGLSAFVGGDILAGIYAGRMAEREELILLVDLGTNGEMVLGNRHRRIACATAAGPAFEGGASRGIWGADMVSLLARLLEEGLMDDTGLLAPDCFEKGVRVGNVLITQEAIRGIQLAKAAIAAGIGILLKRYGTTAEQVDKVILAGGFGYYLNPEDAAGIGLLPAGLAAKAVTGGNTALSGTLLAGRALFAGIDGKALGARLEQIAGETEIVNLAMEPDFEVRYIENLNFVVESID